MNPIKETMGKMMHEMHGAKPTGNTWLDDRLLCYADHFTRIMDCFGRGTDINSISR